MKQANVVVIGAGVIGCAVTMELSRLGHTVTLLEKGPRIGEGTTSRNSGVIHAGIYYPPESLKAEACVRGNVLLYEWCEKHSVPHRRIGKWVIGSLSDQDDLQAIFLNAQNSGVTSLKWGGQSDFSNLKSQGVLAEAGFFSPQTGIIDQFALCRSFVSEGESLGATLVTDAGVQGIERIAGGYQLQTSRGPIDADVVINSAGLNADEVNSWVGDHEHKIYPYRGDYFKLKTRNRYSHLVYPSKKKNAPGLGVHLTIGLDGSYRLGPDVTVVESKDDFSPPRNLELKKIDFFEAASKYLMGIELKDLEYDYCGIRPKLRSPHEKEEKDFLIAEIQPGLISLMGIESPGLTSCLALAEKVAKKLT